MTRLYNRKSLTEMRRLLRKQPIKAEWLLWSKLKMKQLGYKFRRQFSVGSYIIDFYCPILKFAIEIDGSTHVTSEQLNYDKIREEYLTKLGIKLKRHTNYEIFINLNEVITDIKEYGDKLKLIRGITPPNPPLIKGRDIKRPSHLNLPL